MHNLRKWGAIIFAGTLLLALFLRLAVGGFRSQAAGTGDTLISAAPTPTFTPRPLRLPACVVHASAIPSGPMPGRVKDSDAAGVLPRTTQPVPSSTPPIATPVPRRAGPAIVPGNARLLEPLVVIFPGARLNDLAFRGNAEMLTVGYVDKISQWDAHTGQEIDRIVEGNEEAVALCLDLDTDQQLIATGGGAWDNTVRLWDYATGSMRSLGRHRAIVVSVAFSPDGTRLASGDGSDKVHVWDLSSGSQLNTFEGDVAGRYQRFSNLYWPDDDTLVTAGSDVIYRWDVTTGALQERLARPSDAPFFVDVAIAREGNLLAAAAQDSAVYIWDRAGSSWSAWPAVSDGRLMEVTFSPDEKLLAAGTLEGDLLLWDVQTHQQLLHCSGPADSMVAVRFSPDGRYLAGIGWDSTIWLWGIPLQDPEPAAPPPVPEASTLLLLGTGASALLTYIGMQIGSRRFRKEDGDGE